MNLNFCFSISIAIYIFNNKYEIRLDKKMKGSSLQSVALNANQRTPNNMQILHKNKAIKRKLSSSYDKENVNPSAITQNKSILKPTVANENPIKSSSNSAAFSSILEHVEESSNKKAKISQSEFDKLVQVASLEHEMVNLGSTNPDLNHEVARQIIQSDPFIIMPESILMLPERVQLKVSEFHDLHAQIVGII